MIKLFLHHAAKVRFFGQFWVTLSRVLFLFVMTRRRSRRRVRVFGHVHAVLQLHPFRPTLILVILVTIIPVRTFYVSKIRAIPIILSKKQTLRLAFVFVVAFLERARRVLARRPSQRRRQH